MLIKIAWRNLWRHPGRSLIIIFAVIIGLWSILFLSALYEGIVRQRIADVINSESSHIQIHHPSFRVDQTPVHTVPGTDRVVRALQQDTRIKSFSLRQVTTGMINSTGGSMGATFIGIENGLEKKVTAIHEHIVAGNYLQDPKRSEILIGEKLARKMKLHLKSKVVVLCQDTSGDIVSGAFRVQGIYKTNNEPFDESHVFMHKEQLASMLGLPGCSHEIAILLQDQKRLQEVSNNLKAVLPGREIKTWMELSPEMRLLVGVFDEYMMVLMLIVFMAVAFGIVNTMLMSVLERSRELGMMFAVGMNKQRVFLMVTFETFFLMLVGLPAGVLAGMATVTYFGRSGIQFGPENMMSNFGFTNVVYPVLTADHVVTAASVITFITLVSSIYPSLRAVMIKPAEAIRK